MQKSSGGGEQISVGYVVGITMPAFQRRFDLVRRGLDDKMTRKDDMDAQANNKPERQEERKDRPSRSSANMKALITRNLKLAYGEVASEPIPKHLLDLLGAIDDAAEKKS